MTVNNIINMASLKGLDLIALTDHNSAKNCPAILKAAAGTKLHVIPGMEINTSEEIHAVCLFKALENALAFDRYVYERLPALENRPEIFGKQRILDENDTIIGTESKLLINACDISFSELGGLMKEFSGFYFPAHIEKSSYSLLASFGFIPEDADFRAYEVKDLSKIDEILTQNPILKTMPRLRNSDAHYLWDISEAENYLQDSLLQFLI